MRIIATLYAMIGLTEGGSIARLARPLYRRVLSRLRPAEWAVRRLIVIAAHGLKVEPQATRKTAGKRSATGKIKAKVKRRRAFALCDPLARYGFAFGRRSRHPTVAPRIRDFNTPTGVVVYLNGFPPAPPLPPKPEPDGSVSGKSLCRRLDALKRALEDLPGQARRYARLKAKAVAERSPQRDTILRRLPPSNPSRKPRHEVHDILEECDWLARSLPKADTS
jgi:hypothetical protein